MHLKDVLERLPIQSFLTYTYVCVDIFFLVSNSNEEPWSSLVEGDEQLDQPNSQTTMELCHACVAEIFLGVNRNTTAFCLGRYSLHFLLLKSSILIFHSMSQCQYCYRLLKLPSKLIVSCPLCGTLNVSILSLRAQCTYVWFP